MHSPFVFPRLSLCTDFLYCVLTGAVAILLLLAVALLCAYELCAVYVTAGKNASERYSPSGFFFGVSAIALAINMLFICRMVFNGKICCVCNSSCCFASLLWICN